MDYSDLNVPNFIGNSIGPKKVKIFCQKAIACNVRTITIQESMKTDYDVSTLILIINYCPENVVCFLRLPHILIT